MTVFTSNQFTTSRFQNTYRLTENRIDFIRNGCVQSISLTEQSGNIIYRNKIDTIIGIKHPGIILGVDGNDNTWVIHNHYSIGHPEIVTLEEFANGIEIFFDRRKASYSTREIIERALQHWRENKEYTWLRYNCQQFVNDVARNERRSESIDFVCDRMMIFGLLIALIGYFSKNSTAVKTGLIVGGAGLGGKFLSR